MSDVFDHIDRHFDQYIAELSDWCRQPSVSAQHRGMSEMAKLVTGKMRRLGFKAEMYPVETGHPIVVGELAGEREMTILFYNHYDVQPPEPESAWTSPPFDPTIREGSLYARGVSDNKGTLLARLQAIEALLETRGRLPVRVKFMVDGEEEVGSPSLAGFVDAHRELLKADVCLWENGAKDEHERPILALGNKGVLVVELAAQTMKRDYHSQFAPILPSAGWALLWTLATLKGPDGFIRIDGFYDGINPPSAVEGDLIARMTTKDQELRERAGVASLLGGVTGVDANRVHLTEPTCNICGFETGYNGPGFKAVLPATAQARVDFRLVPGQDPDDIWEKLVRHLDRHGRPGVTVRRLADCHPSNTPAEHWFVGLVADAAQVVYAKAPSIHPRSAGFSPRYVFTRWSDLPIVGTGVGYAQSGAHAPNEHIRLADYREGIKHIAEILTRLSER